MWAADKLKLKQFPSRAIFIHSATQTPYLFHRFHNKSSWQGCTLFQSAWCRCKKTTVTVEKKQTKNQKPKQIKQNKTKQNKNKTRQAKQQKKNMTNRTQTRQKKKRNKTKQRLNAKKKTQKNMIKQTIKGEIK